MSLVLEDLTPVLRDTIQKGAGPQRWQHPTWIDHLPPCNIACPAGENIQAWLAHVREGRCEAAWRTLVRDNPLPGIHGRACYHPCEGSCSRKDLDESVSIHAVERFLGDLAMEQGWKVPPGKPTGKKVLVVGAGPGGLSCAWHLRLMGHEVEIRDAQAEPGGMMHYGIPAYRLPRAEMLAEIKRIEDMGVRMVMNTRVDDVVMAMKAGGFDACFIAIGTHDGNHLDIPAADGKQMIDAISMLEHVEKGMMPNLGRVVAIVGGGNTAMDAARVARRLGVEEAIIIYRRDRAHMRAEPYEADSAFLEGVQARWLTNPTRFGKEGVTIEHIALNEDGSLQPTGELETLPVNSLVLALGQTADVEFVRKVSGVEIGRDDTIVVDERLMTGHPGIFAGGDVVGGPRTMTAATGHGKKAARAIDAWLSGRDLSGAGQESAGGFRHAGSAALPRRRPHAHERAAGRGAHGLRRSRRRHYPEAGPLRSRPLPVVRQLLRMRQLPGGLPGTGHRQARRGTEIRRQPGSLHRLRDLLRPVPLPCHRDGRRAEDGGRQDGQPWRAAGTPQIQSARLSARRYRKWLTPLSRWTATRPSRMSPTG